VPAELPIPHPRTKSFQELQLAMTPLVQYKRPNLKKGLMQSCNNMLIIQGKTIIIFETRIKSPWTRVFPNFDGIQSIGYKS